MWYWFSSSCTFQAFLSVLGPSSFFTIQVQYRWLEPQSCLMTHLTLAINATMNTVLYNGSIPFQVTVQQVPTPRIQEPIDDLVRITKAALCGSDLHYYRGFRPFESPSGGIGHEAIGYIAETGSGVRSLSVGDYVIIPSAADDGEIELAPTRQTFFSGLQGISQLQTFSPPYICTNNRKPQPNTPSSPSQTEISPLSP